MNDTKQALTELFKQNTGKSILDSGSHYGRNFEENQKMDDLEVEKPELSISVRSMGDNKVEVLPTVSTFHYLLKNGEYRGDLTEYFHNWAKDKKGNWLSVMEQFIEERKGQPATVNTYNHEYSNMSQIVQFIPFEIERGDFEGDIEVTEVSSQPYSDMVLLQVHNGCDVRGGYTKPIIMEIDASRLVTGASSLDISCENHLFTLTEGDMYEWELPEVYELVNDEYIRCKECEQEVNYFCGGFSK